MLVAGIAHYPIYSIVFEINFDNKPGRRHRKSRVRRAEEIEDRTRACFTAVGICLMRDANDTPGTFTMLEGNDFPFALTSC